MNNLPNPISVTSEMLDRFPQFADEHEVKIGDILEAISGEADHERAEAAQAVDRLESEGRFVRLMALTDQLDALLSSMSLGAQAASAIWAQIVSEVDQASEGQADAVWSELHGRYLDAVIEQAFTIASMIANEDVR